MKVKREVIINSAGDTLIIVNTGHEDMKYGMRRVRMEREITINSDGDTMIVANVTSPGMRMRRYGQGDRTRQRVRHRFGHRGRKRDRGRDMSLWHEERRELREMEMEARRLARELRQADEESYREKEEELRVQLEKIFDYKQDVELEEIDQKRSSLERQSKTMEERRENKEVIIEDRINQLLGRGSSYRWSP